MPEERDMSGRVTIAEAKDRVGDAVIYGGGPSAEQGYITSVNDSYVFVRFGSAAHGIACRPDDLLWLARAAAEAPCPECGVRDCWHQASGI